MKTSIAMLCVALSLVFAGASGASVVDKIQHQDRPTHDHEHVAFSDISFEDHHQDRDHGDHDDGGAADLQPGSGHHHHADAPTGLIAAGEHLDPVAVATGARRAIRSDDLVRSPGPPGPERPPKRFTTRI